MGAAALTVDTMSPSYSASRQGSSAVEQGTHKPLVGSSILPPGSSQFEIGRSALGVRRFLCRL
jgi:hypothetical protein